MSMYYKLKIEPSTEIISNLELCKTQNFVLTHYTDEQLIRYEANRLRTIAMFRKLGRNFDDSKENWCPIYNKGKLDIAKWTFDCGQTCFDSAKDCCEAIDIIGGEQVVKYIIGRRRNDECAQNPDI